MRTNRLPQKGVLVGWGKAGGGLPNGSVPRVLYLGDYTLKFSPTPLLGIIVFKPKKTPCRGADLKNLTFCLGGPPPTQSWGSLYLGEIPPKTDPLSSCFSNGSINPLGVIKLASVLTKTLDWLINRGFPAPNPKIFILID